MKNIILTVDSRKELLEFLYDKLQPMPKKKIKSFLTHHSIVVDGRVSTQYNYMLRPGQTVLVDMARKYDFLHQNNIELIYEDDEILVINKPCRTLSVVADDPDEENAFALLTQYVRLDNKTAQLFVVHRLDRDTSGVLMFCKTEKLKKALQDDWNNLVKKRLYYAVTEGCPKEKQGNVTLYLKQDSNTRMYASGDNQGERSETEYQVVKENEEYALIKVNISTGKKNQIRVAMKELGHPIVGDKKYGAKSNPLKRMGLHAQRLALVHPETGKELSFEAKIPNVFNKLF